MPPAWAILTELGLQSLEATQPENKTWKVVVTTCFVRKKSPSWVFGERMRDQRGKENMLPDTVHVTKPKRIFIISQFWKNKNPNPEKQRIKI